LDKDLLNMGVIVFSAYDPFTACAGHALLREPSHYQYAQAGWVDPGKIDQRLRPSLSGKHNRRQIKVQ